MTGHTPGPWRAGLGSVWTTPGEQLICAEVSGPADAALIASAPEQQAKIDALAAALEGLLAVEDEAEVIPAQCRAQAALRAIGRIP